MSGVVSAPGSEPTDDRRLRGHHRELVLRTRDGHHEIISNGVMLMDTRGDSYRMRAPQHNIEQFRKGLNSHPQ